MGWHFHRAGGGYLAGEKFNVDVADLIDKSHGDAQLFYERYGCGSHTARTFFDHVDQYANRLGDASLTTGLEKNYQRCKT